MMTNGADANGNMTTQAGRITTFTAFNRVGGVHRAGLDRHRAEL
jgi:hypothetical protein